MDSWRIIVNLINRSNSIKSPPPSGMGALVIPAVRGKGKPVKIHKGQTSRILQLYGSETYHVLEAIAYNDKYPLWICAPHKNGIFSALLLTNDGLAPITVLSDDVDFTALLTSASMGKGQDGVKMYAVTLPYADKLTKARRLSLMVGGVMNELTVSDSGDPDVLNVVCPLGTGTLNTDTGQLEFEFTNEPGVGIPIYTRYEVDISGIAYAVFGMAFPCEDFLGFSVNKTEKGNNLSISLAEKSNGVYSRLPNFPMEVSLKKGMKNDAGKVIFIGEMLKDHDLIFAKVNAKKPFDISLWDAGETAYTDFTGGNRGDEVTGVELTKGWMEFKSLRKYPADIYFDTTGEQAVKAAMIALRNGPIPYKRFLAPVAVGFPNVDDVLAIEGLPSNRGLSVFWGAAYIQNPYAPTGDLLSTLMGEVAAKFADALVFSYGGRAVSWSDENNVGGQLTGGRIISFLYDADPVTELKDMDKKRINPIVQHELFGPMIASRRTTDTSESDYSYTDYSAIVDYCVERLVNEVLPYQITKFNDDIHRADVATRSELIIKPLTVPPNNVIREYAIKCDAENNDDEVMARQEFILTVGIKVTPKSEMVILNFINAGQTMRVEELVK